MPLNNRVLIGLSVGAALGASLAYVFTTKSGQKVLKDFKAASDDVIEDLLDLAEAGVERSVDIWYKSQAASEDLSSSIESLKKSLRR